MKNRNVNNNRLELNLTPTACAGDDIGLLIKLVQTEKIGVKMLLQNVTEILKDDPNLLVTVVNLITDANRIQGSDATDFDYAKAMNLVERDTNLKQSDVLLKAIKHAAEKAGFQGLPS